MYKVYQRNREYPKKIAYLKRIIKDCFNLVLKNEPNRIRLEKDFFDEIYKNKRLKKPSKETMAEIEQAVENEEWTYKKFCLLFPKKTKKIATYSVFSEAEMEKLFFIIEFFISLKNAKDISVKYEIRKKNDNIRKYFGY